MVSGWGVWEDSLSSSQEEDAFVANKNIVKPAISSGVISAEWISPLKGEQESSDTSMPQLKTEEPSLSPLRLHRLAVIRGTKMAEEPFDPRPSAAWG